MINIHIDTVNVSINMCGPDDCSIEPCDHTAMSTREYVQRRHAEWELNNPANYDIEPYDMLVEPKTDLPVSFRFSVPGKPGEGYAAAQDLKATLEGCEGRFYYRISGRTAPSRRLLYAIGCTYDKMRCCWYCMEPAMLEPYIIPGTRVG